MTGVRPDLIQSVAILKLNWDLYRHDYLQVFVPMVAECIRLSPDAVVSTHELQREIFLQFGLNLPQNVLRTILRRCAKDGYVIREHNVYHRNDTRLATLGFDKLRTDVMGRHEALVSTLIQYCREKFGLNWNRDEAEAALNDYLQASKLLVPDLLATGVGDPLKHARPSNRYVIGSCIDYLRTNKLPEFSYLETIVVGDMLANAVFLKDPGSPGNRFRGTAIYFDTAFLIYALGYAGEPRRAPCIELLDLLYESGADLRCFEHTLDEVRGILDACFSMMSTGNLGTAYGPSIEYFLASGFSASDIELFRARLRENVEGLRIKVSDKPPYGKGQYLIDEKELQSTLQKLISYKNDKALQRDVDSLSAVMRLRQGKQYYRYEECRALFVTTNSLLAQVSNTYLCSTSDNGAVPSSITDYALTTLLWLKRPLGAPDLPRKRIIADCYAASQPDDRFLQKYISEVQKLQNSHAIKGEDYYLLRHSLEARATLMRVTLGDEDAFAEGTVQEILNVVRKNIEAEAREELKGESKRRVEAEAQADAERKAREHEEQALRTNIAVRARRYGTWITFSIKAIVTVVLVIAVASTFPWDLPNLGNSPLRYAILAIQTVLLILTVISFVAPPVLDRIWRRLEVAIARRVEEFLNTIVGPTVENTQVVHDHQGM